MSKVRHECCEHAPSDEKIAYALVRGKPECHISIVLSSLPLQLERAIKEFNTDDLNAVYEMTYREGSKNITSEHFSGTETDQMTYVENDISAEGFTKLVTP